MICYGHRSSLTSPCEPLALIQSYVNLCVQVPTRLALPQRHAANQNCQSLVVPRLELYPSFPWCYWSPLRCGSLMVTITLMQNPLCFGASFVLYIFFLFVLREHFSWQENFILEVLVMRVFFSSSLVSFGFILFIDLTAPLGRFC